jgi:hypothetical protein
MEIMIALRPSGLDKYVYHRLLEIPWMSGVSGYSLEIMISRFQITELLKYGNKRVLTAARLIKVCVSFIRSVGVDSNPKL